MNARTQTRGEVERIVAEFEVWVKQLSEQARAVEHEGDQQRLEEQVRTEGLAMLGRVFQQLMQQAIDEQQERQRTCSDCGGRRRHQGVRPRTLKTGFGEIRVHGIYWRCPDCGSCGHSAERIMPEAISAMLRQMTTLLGASMASFHKAEVVVRRVVGVDLDDETIRRRCLTEGWEASRDADVEPAQAPEGQTLLGSCDGTMVRTRETGWREVKGYRFEHEHGRFGGASLEKADRFAPRLKQAADRLGQGCAGRCVFVSDMAGWIKGAVEKQLPGWLHIGDFYHASEHIHATAELLYGKHEPRTKKWAVYWSRRLKRYGGAGVAQRMRRTVLCYHDLKKQSRLLKLVHFFDKHAERMDYPRYQADDLPIGSGPMESFCKQLGGRMKGPGMFWSVCNVTPMAMLMSRWSLEPERFAGLESSGAAA